MVLQSYNFHLIKLQDSNYEHVFKSIVENSVDPDQLASEKPADLDLRCFQNKINPGSACLRSVLRNIQICANFLLRQPLSL